MVSPERPETHPLGVEWLRLQNTINHYNKMSDTEFDIKVRNASPKELEQLVQARENNPDQLPARLIYIFRLQEEQENIEAQLYTQTNFNLPRATLFRYLMRQL